MKGSCRNNPKSRSKPSSKAKKTSGDKAVKIAKIDFLC
jgi:hypothetical protein